MGAFQRPLTLLLPQKCRDTNGSRIAIQMLRGVYTTFCQEEGILLQASSQSKKEKKLINRIFMGLSQDFGGDVVFVLFLPGFGVLSDRFSKKKKRRKMKQRTKR